MLVSALLAAGVLTTSQQNAHLKRTVDIFLPMVRSCGIELLHHYGKTSVHRDLSFSADPRDRGKTVAAVELNGSNIILYPLFFEQSPEDDAKYLVHEWLHTQGVAHEDDPGGHQGINRTVWKFCSVQTASK